MNIPPKLLNSLRTFHLSLCEHSHKYVHLCILVHIIVHINIVFNSVQLQNLASPNCSLSPHAVLPNRFYSFLYPYKYSKLISFRTHSWSSIIYTSQTITSTLNWASWLVLKLAFMFIEWSPNEQLCRINNLIWGCMSHGLWASLTGWILTWLHAPHSMGFTVSNQLFPFKHSSRNVHYRNSARILILHRKLIQLFSHRPI